MRTVFGGPEGGEYPSINAPEDKEFFNKVAHVLKRPETLLEFTQRTGLGRTQALGMTALEITRFVEQAERNSADMEKEPREVDGIGLIRPQDLPKVPNYATSAGFSRVGS